MGYFYLVWAFLLRASSSSSGLVVVRVVGICFSLFFSCLLALSIYTVCTLLRLKGKLNIVVLGRGLLLFEFELLSEAERVLLRGKRKVKDNVLFLGKWHPEVGCFCNEPMLTRLG